MFSKIIGDAGENFVAQHYKKMGYKILSRNFSCKFGELDIVAIKNKVIVIVEVKTRKDAQFADAREAVNFNKQRKIKNAALYFLQQQQLSDYFTRFDVAEVYWHSKELNIIENAF